MRAFVACSNRLALLLALLWPTGAMASDVSVRLALLAHEDLRVATIFTRLQRAATADCTDKAPMMGIILHDLSQYAPVARSEVAAQFGLGNHVAVAGVVPGSAAERAGLKQGDAVIAVAGSPLPEVRLDRQTSEASRDAAVAIARMLQAGDVTLTVIRGGAPREIVLTPEMACAARIELTPSEKFDAREGQGLVTITTALVELFDRDDPLAFLIAHELAHVALGHRAAESATQEDAADVLGLGLTARAGYDPRAAADGLARLAAARHQRRRLDPGHPSLDRRIDALRQRALTLKKDHPPSQNQAGMTAR